MKLKNFFSRYYLILLFSGSFVLWVYSFQGFITAKLAISSDAQAYFGHFNYFINNMSRAVYPMWEAPRQSGVPVDFFMKRIGAFNPFFIPLILLTKLGIPYISMHGYFLTFYYFVGMLGFYFLAKAVLNNTKAAFIAYLLLMFSALGTRLWDSYILLTIIPLIWFFYFLVVFIKKPEKLFF